MQAFSFRALSYPHTLVALGVARGKSRRVRFSPLFTLLSRRGSELGIRGCNGHCFVCMIIFQSSYESARKSGIRSISVNISEPFGHSHAVLQMIGRHQCHSFLCTLDGNASRAPRKSTLPEQLLGGKVSPTRIVAIQ